MAATVVLLHRTADGREHFDWLLQRESGGPLITFRTHERPDASPPATLRAERLADHRETYLTYEGPVPGGRGTVRRIATGNCTVIAETADGLSARVRFGPFAADLRAGRVRKSLWDIALYPDEPAPRT